MGASSVVKLVLVVLFIYSASVAADDKLQCGAGEQKYWLYRSCGGNEDCKADNSECFDGYCQCSPGYFYSNTSHCCVDECSQPQNNLPTRSGYIIFRDSYLWGDEGKLGTFEMEHWNDHVCFEKCTKDAKCLSIVYVCGGEKCQCTMFSTIAGDAGVCFSREKPPFATSSSYDQKRCDLLRK